MPDNALYTTRRLRAHPTDVWQAIARVQPGSTALETSDGERITYERFAREAGSLADALMRRGVAPGRAVAILLHNRAEFLITTFACLATGRIPVPLNYRFRAAEVQELLEDSGAAALVYPASLASVVTEAVERVGHEVLLISIDDAPEADAPGLAWADAVEGDAPLPGAAPEQSELWIYTGGTTGRPKAVRWSTRDLFEVQSFSAYALSGRPVPATAEEAVDTACDARYPRIVTLPLAPFMHGTALTSSMNTLTVGGTVLITGSPSLDAEAVVRFANDAGATRLVVAGDGVSIPLVEAAERMRARLSSVTSVMSSGMRFSPDVKRRLHQLGDLTIHDLLASTEGGGFAVTTTSGVDDLPGRPKLFPAATVLDEHQRDIRDQPGALGVLARRGALPLGYHGDESQTAATFPMIGGERHVVPGDWVRVEDDGHIEFLGRGSGVINTGGEKVYPLEVEEALLAHEAVGDAVVVGIPDRRFGEVVTAVVERVREVAVDELLAHLDGLLAGYKKPRHIVFRTSLDRTPTGKVDIRGMRDEVVRDRDQKGSS